MGTTLELGDRAAVRENDERFARVWTLAGREGRDAVVADGDVLVVRVISGGRSAREAFGEALVDARTPARLTAIRIDRGGGGADGARRGRDGGVRYAFVCRDANFSMECRGKYATVHGDGAVIRFENAAVTKAAHWEVTEATEEKNGGTRVRFRSCERRGVWLEAVIRERTCSALTAFEAWCQYERAVEYEERYQERLDVECETLLEKLAAGFAKELRAIEAEIIDAGRAKFGGRVVEADALDSPKMNPFQVASPALVPRAPDLDRLPSLEKRSTAVNPSTPAGGLASWRHKQTLVETYPSPTDDEIAGVRDESWRFTSTGKKSAKANPFGEVTPATSTKTPQNMSDYWDFEDSDDEFYDAGTPGVLGATTSATGATKVTTKTSKVLFEGKYNRLESEDVEVAAIRKSGIDPRDVVSTPGTTSAMLKYVGQMYVSEFRSEMNILNIPTVTLDEVVVDFVEYAASRRKDPSFKDSRTNPNDALTEKYIMSMKTDDFLTLLQEYNDEAGYTEVATLKRALAIAITTKGALSSSDDER